MTSAVLRVRYPSGKLATFYASRCVVDHGAVVAVGHFKDRPGRDREWIWPLSRVLEIREVVA